MTTSHTTVILLLSAAVAVLVALVAVFVVLFYRKNRELQAKNDVIIHEVERNRTIIDRAEKLGVNRSALTMH